MPRATVDLEATERVDLETCPGGYVVLQRYDYGASLERDAMAMEMKVRGEGGGREGMEAELKGAGLKVAFFEFAKCIVEHNLEDADGKPLDFKVSQHVRVLDPRIGQEIGKKIDEMNSFKEDLGK